MDVSTQKSASEGQRRMRCGTCSALSLSTFSLSSQGLSLTLELVWQPASHSDAPASAPHIRVTDVYKAKTGFFMWHWDQNSGPCGHAALFFSD